MGKSIVRMTPDQLGYRDRGIVKWFGMMLSDHSEALKKEEINNFLAEVEAKQEMSEEEISKLLRYAFVNNSPILIQANVMRNGSYYEDIQCKVSGQSNGKIYFKLKDGRSTSCTIEEIRNVEMMNSIYWYDKSK